jgi:flagellar M-ring protein FliF
MNEFFKKIFEQIKTLWGKWSVLQKVILFGIVVIAIGGIIALVSVSSAPTMVPVIDAPIRDENLRDRIITRINEEGVRTSVSAGGVVMVSDAAAARRMQAILFREDLIPQGTDPWALFDEDRWTITDYERNVNLQRSITQKITNLIKALDDVDNAQVSITVPTDRLFASEQNPVTASVIIFPKPGSDISENRKKIEGIQKILMFAVEGLQANNLVITDQNGLVLNDFEGMAAMDRLSLIERETKMVQNQERTLRDAVLKALQQTFTSDRVRDLNITIDKDMSKKTVETTEFFPITIKPRTPGLPYDDSLVVPSIPRSESTSSTAWKGTGFNPEGPAGVEGNTTPAFRDMSNLYGEVEQETRTHNEELNSRNTQEERSPSINRVTVSVNIDGTWKWKYDEKKQPVILEDGSIEREYTPVAAADLAAAQELIRDAVGYSAARGDSVTVQNIRFDRTREFGEEDAAYFREQQMQRLVLIFLIGVAILLIGFVAFRVISREMERRRRLREEELARQQQAMREAAMLEGENEGIEVSMSVEEKRRMELQESAINAAKEHPGDVANLIRTWLMEE